MPLEMCAALNSLQIILQTLIWVFHPEDGDRQVRILTLIFQRNRTKPGVKRVQQCHTVSKQQMRPRTKLPVKYLAHRTFESISLSDLETRVPSRLTTPRVLSGHSLTSGHLSQSSSVGEEQKPHKEKDPLGLLSYPRCHFHQERAWGEIPVMATMKFYHSFSSFSHSKSDYLGQLLLLVISVN